MRRLAFAFALLPCVLVAQAKPAATAKPPRMLFVVDAVSEEPLAGAVVLDLVTKNSMKTSKDGVVGLLVPSFVKRTGALLEVRMPGYVASPRTFVDPTSDTTLVIYLLSDSAARARQIVRKRTDSTVFLIEVLDEAGAPMPDATVSIVRGLATALASRVTDSSGTRLLVVPEVAGDVQITVQKVGYNPYRQFYRLNIADTVAGQVAMFRLAQQLPDVTVKATNYVKRKIYHLEANEIANSKRPLFDALDAIRKLRPTMFGDRTRGMDGCGTADHIFVNGKRIWDAPQSVDLKRLPRRAQPARSARGNTGASAGFGRARYAPPSGEAAMAERVRGVLAGIKPEHVDEMTYLDCFDTHVPGNRTNNAIYVVLKYGIEYDEIRGSTFARDTIRRK